MEEVINNEALGFALFVFMIDAQVSCFIIIMCAAGKRIGI